MDNIIHYPLLLVQNVIGAPLPSRLHGYLSSPSCHILLELFGLIKLLIQDSEDSSLTKMASTVAEMVTAAVHKTGEMIKVHGSEGADQLAGRRTLLEHVVNIIEVRLCLFRGE